VVQTIAMGQSQLKTRKGLQHAHWTKGEWLAQSKPLELQCDGYFQKGLIHQDCWHVSCKKSAILQMAPLSGGCQWASLGTNFRVVPWLVASTSLPCRVFLNRNPHHSVATSCGTFFFANVNFEPPERFTCLSGYAFSF